MDATYRTCQLMLPTFFLAMKTDVGYSPIATFIVEMEDALLFLKHWVELKTI